jgi:SAM-dependent methyltransferase
MSSNASLPKMYRELAHWFHILTPPEEYAVEAEFYGGALVESAEIPVRTVLELGSGGGNNASHLKSRFEFTLVDLSEEMLDLSRSINPECVHAQGDMRTIRLGRQFDALFVHDAIDYMTNEDDLGAVITTAFEHCSPGGAAVFAPDHIRETFQPKTDHGGGDDEKRALRYLEWTWDPDPHDDTYTVDYAYLLRDESGVRVGQDRHICGLFPRATWIRLIEGAGFRAEVLEGIKDETAPEVFVGMKPLPA